MVIRTQDGLVHFVHATEMSIIKTVCGLSTSYLPDEISDSWNDPPTCFKCLVEPYLWHRPPFELSDKRYRKVK